MGRKTSFYLSDEDDALLRAAKARGTGLAEIFHRGLQAEDPALTLARAAAVEALEALRPDLEEWVGAAVQRAFAKAQGGY